MTEDRAVDPIKLHLMNGEEHDLLPSFGALRRASKKVEGGSVLGAIGSLPEQAIVPLLYECLSRAVREKLTQEDFEDQLPVGTETLGVVAKLSKLLGDSGNAPTSRRKPTGSRSGRKPK